MLFLGIFIGVFFGIVLMSTLIIVKNRDEVTQDTLAKLMEKSPLNQ